MYRVHEKNTEVKPDERKENCRLWQKLSSEEIPLEDIEKVVTVGDIVNYVSDNR
jgi:hypothetical protein